MKDNQCNIKITKAAALKYESGKDSAPRLIASGKGELAKKILDIAKQHDIVVYNDPELVDALIKLEIDQEIPPHLYEIMAKILAFIYEIDITNGQHHQSY
jgi:flagellar biosynthesis protein